MIYVRIIDQWVTSDSFFRVYIPGLILSLFRHTWVMPCIMAPILSFPDVPEGPNLQASASKFWTKTELLPVPWKESGLFLAFRYFRISSRNIVIFFSDHLLSAGTETSRPSLISIDEQLTSDIGMSPSTERSRLRMDDMMLTYLIETQFKNRMADKNERGKTKFIYFYVKYSFHYTLEATRMIKIQINPLHF